MSHTVRFKTRLLRFGEHWHSDCNKLDRHANYGSRLPYHMNYCRNCRTLYFNHRFKTASALPFMLWLYAGATDQWTVAFRSRASMDVFDVIWA